MKQRIITLSLALIVLTAWDAAAKINEKFFRNAAEKVWSTGTELFNAATVIPDSIAAGESAVVICEYDFVDVDRDAGSNTDYTKRTVFNRRMVKLLDNSAVENFAEFEFGSKSQRKDIFNYTFAKKQDAFGARVYKADGTVVDVDITTALPITKGKDGKETEAYRIAIPGLEPGDIIDYFNYWEEKLDMYSLPPLGFVFGGNYPTLTYVFEGTFSPEITVEYRSYNDAPDLARGTNGKRNVLAMMLNNIPVVHDSKGLRVHRQKPYFNIYTLNNNPRYVYRPYSARKGGVYNVRFPSAVFKDMVIGLAQATYDGSNVPLRIKKQIDAYFKAHPEPMPYNKKFEAAWVAAMYGQLTNEREDASDMWFSMILYDMLPKIGLNRDDSGIGFINSRYEVPTTEILNWKEPHYGVAIGDSIFITGEAVLYAPGELPGDYQGEDAAVLVGPRKKYHEGTQPRIFKTPTSKSRQNTTDVLMDVVLSPDDDGLFTAKAHHNVKLTGGNKAAAIDINGPVEWLKEAERFLGIPENKAYKLKNYDEVERRAEIKDAMDDFTAVVLGHTPSEIDNIDIVSHGTMPDRTAFEINFDGSYQGLFSNVGNDLIFNVGALVPETKTLTGVERERYLDYYFSNPFENKYIITVALPEGYEADAESLAALSSNMARPSGMFYTTAALDDTGRTLTLTVVRRNKNYVVEADKFDKFLDILDASSAFHEASLLLRAK